MIKQKEKNNFSSWPKQLYKYYTPSLNIAL